jgi:hypothetical protein
VRETIPAICKFLAKASWQLVHRLLSGTLQNLTECKRAVGACRPFTRNEYTHWRASHAPPSPLRQACLRLASHTQKERDYLLTSSLLSRLSMVLFVFPYSTKSLTNEERFLATSAFDFKYC